MKKSKDETTSELMGRLFETPALDDFFSKNPAASHLPPFYEYISNLCVGRGETREHIIRLSGIDRTYGHQLFNGTRKPSRDKVVQLAFGFGLNLEETQQLLKMADKSPLYPRIERDAAIVYSIMRKMRIEKVQELLEHFGMEMLGG